MALEEAGKKATSESQAIPEGLFGRIAISLGYVTEAQLADALAEQEATRSKGGELRLGQILLKRRLLSTTQFLRVMAEQESIVGGSDQRPTMVRGEFGDPAETGIESLALAPGKMLGRYEILRQIGRGGMGIVYEARDSALKRRIALKVLREDMVGPGMTKRLEREAVTAARLKHPNIVTLYETNVLQGVRYLSMEFVEGKSLRELIERGQLELARKVEVLEAIARAVDYAHSRGVIHRDLKPANVVIDTEGRPMIMDFGLARLLDDFSHTSRTGALVGTPAYMAPEQITGTSADVDTRTDVYALGVLFYEMLSGRVPFEGTDPSAVCTKILSEDPVPLVGIPKDLECLVRKAMARDRDARYSSAGELADELRRYREGEPVRSAPRSFFRTIAQVVRRHRAVAAGIAVALLCLVLALGFVAGYFLHRESQRRAMREEAKQAESRGDWEAAIQAWARLHELGDEGASGSLREASRRQQVQRERVKAMQIRAEATAAEKEYRTLQESLAALDENLRVESDQVQSHDPPEKKQPLWRLERERDRVRSDLLAVEAKAIGLHISAMRYDPSEASGLLAFLWDLLAQAERVGDAAHARLHEETLRQLIVERNLTEELKRLEAGGVVNVTSNPAGADVDLWRFEEKADRRWIAGEVQKNLGKTPVDAISLPKGSYLLKIRKPGFRETKLPILVGRGSEQSLRIRLYTEEEIGAEYVYVPAGEFISGDPQAYLGVPRRPRAETGEFFIGRHEVTVQEYLEYLNDLLARGEAEHDVRHRLPYRAKSQAQFRHREENDKASPWVIPEDLDPRAAVSGVAWEDAKAYASWLSALRKETYRIPSVSEWEKAARGVDGRAFPWGERFDWTFTVGYYSAAKPPGVRRIGSVVEDESPYGVRDLGGNVTEYCEDWFDLQKRFRVACGGSAGHTVEIHFRAGARHPYSATSAMPWAGFRLVKVPPKR